MPAMKSLPLLFGVSWLLACGGKAPPSAPPAPASALAPAPESAPAPAPAPAPEPAPAPAPAPDPAPAPAPAPAPDPGSDSAELTQCKAILVKSWTAVAPVIAKLGVIPDESIRTSYVSDQTYLDACVALPQDKRDCLTLADNPVLGLKTCKINEPNQVLSAFDFGDKIAAWPSAPLDPEEVGRLTRWLAGTWLSTWDKAQEQQRWVIGAGGQVTSATVVRRGQPDTEALVPDTVAFKQTRKLEVHWKGKQTTQSFSFLMAGDDVFLASGNGLYDAYPVEDEKRFMVRHGWEFILFDNGRCEVIFGTGLSVPATCSFEQDGDKRLFKTEFQRPGATRPSTTSHVIIGKHFVVDSMFESARFVRQK